MVCQAFTASPPPCGGLPAPLVMDKRANKNAEGKFRTLIWVVNFEAQTSNVPWEKEKVFVLKLPFLDLKI